MLQSPIIHVTARRSSRRHATLFTARYAAAEEPRRYAACSGALVYHIAGTRVVESRLQRTKAARDYGAVRAIRMKNTSFEKRERDESIIATQKRKRRWHYRRAAAQQRHRQCPARMGRHGG